MTFEKSPEILIVPGYHGSGNAHWQTWLEAEMPNARRVTGIDWEQPILNLWANQIVRELDASQKPVIIVAHSFGCLASAVAIARRPHKIAGCILVAPADPERFTLFGRKRDKALKVESVAQYLPDVPLCHLGLLIGSQNDPWMRLQHAYAWAERWGLTFFNAGNVGHINVDSGHGRWPLIRVLSQTFCNLAMDASTTVSSIEEQDSLNSDELDRSSFIMNFANPEGIDPKLFLYA